MFFKNSISQHSESLVWNIQCFHTKNVFYKIQCFHTRKMFYEIFNLSTPQKKLSWNSQSFQVRGKLFWKTESFHTRWMFFEKVNLSKQENIFFWQVQSLHTRERLVWNIPSPPHWLMFFLNSTSAQPGKACLKYSISPHSRRSFPEILKLSTPGK